MWSVSRSEGRTRSNLLGCWQLCIVWVPAKFSLCIRCTRWSRCGRRRKHSVMPPRRGRAAKSASISTAHQSGECSLLLCFWGRGSGLFLHALLWLLSWNCINQLLINTKSLKNQALPLPMNSQKILLFALPVEYSEEGRTSYRSAVPPEGMTFLMRQERSTGSWEW